ncbi:C-terminal binding protein [Rhodococcus rhodochrous]|uniref:C-terminal binding protein n=1 Tax=Rhodococcus rhodochrous TaxID=1829 RepID=UPI001E3DB8B9|nr:C-terminal binding protein [Rhodococcus rhodochrous]MCD2098467.1 C-terminal binding protein [Rhodococcus rhodochrous]MCD2123053.1 C-terminal binding protein [Rhodococcus rhodochrous]MCQ4135957.1 C-terminal binding protein [Rhodococcus rhodochrous]MDJ0019777.1 C-terminal binding protein [Rhodococcus rhodochrous]
MASPIAVYTDLDDLDPTEGIALLEAEGFEVRVLETRDPDTIAAAAADASALLVGYAPVDAALLDRLPQVGIVSMLSRGYDSVDVAAATVRDVWVATVGDVATTEVATHTWALTLAAVRRLDFFALGRRRGWLDRPQYPPRSLAETTLGLVGLGRIGSEVAALASGSVGTILGYDRAGRALPSGVTPASLAEVVAGSDVVSIHLPLDDSTEKLFDADLLATMRPGAWLINVSRGGIVDSGALADALDAGHLAGAALDVLDVEPPVPGDRLAEHPNVLLTPHVAYLSGRTAREYIRMQAANVVEWYRTGAPSHSVNDPHEVIA